MKTALRIFVLIFMTACQPKNTFTWGSEENTHVGIFDSDLYTKKQLEDNYKLCKPHFAHYAQFGFNQDGQLVNDIESEKLNDIINEYLTKKTEIEFIKPIDSGFWTKLKKQKLEELEDEYYLKKLTAESFQNPKVLIGNRFSNISSKYIDIINNNDTTELMTQWKLLMKYYESIDSGKIETYKQFFNEKHITQKSKFINARIDLVVFGWRDELFKKLSNDSYINAQEEFKKLFVSIEEKYN